MRQPTPIRHISCTEGGSKGLRDDASIDATRARLFPNYRPRWQAYPNRLPINQIRVGSTPDPEFVLARVHLLTQKLGYSDIPLTYSGIPLRAW